MSKLWIIICLTSLLNSQSYSHTEGTDGEKVQHNDSNHQEGQEANQGDTDDNLAQEGHNKEDQSDEKMQRILDYNEDDCIAMMVLKDELVKHC